jgi:hypothetical protein
METLNYNEKGIFDRSIFDQVESVEFNLKSIRKNKLEKYSSKRHLARLLEDLVRYQVEGKEQATKQTTIAKVN